MLFHSYLSDNLQLTKGYPLGIYCFSFTMEEKMRVFDFYMYNIATIVSRADTVAYLENMLLNQHLSYTNVSFSISELAGKEISDLIKDYPNLFKYKFYYERNNKQILTSMTPEWNQGKIYIDHRDLDSIFEIFSKKKNGYKINGGLVLQQIDWYGTGIQQAVLDRYTEMGKATLCTCKGIVNNSIVIERNVKENKRHNFIQIVIEATTEAAPRDTGEIIKKLEPYLGIPYSYHRNYYYSSEQTKQFIAYEDDTVLALNEELADFAKLYGYRHKYYSPCESSLSIINKKMISKVFEETEFTLLDERKKGDRSGMNWLMCIDKHHFVYEVLIDRTSDSPHIFFVSFSVKGCNFSISSDPKAIEAKTKEEAEDRLHLLAEFVCSLKNKYGIYLSERFGDTPKWYLDIHKP